MEPFTISQNVPEYPRRRSKCKCITFIIIITLLIIITIALLGIFSAEFSVKKNAALISANVDMTVQPCDNFYKFSCQNYMNYLKLMKNETTINKFELSKNNIRLLLNVSINELSTSTKFKPFKLVKNFYNMCMNNSVREDRKASTLMEILERLGGWPVLYGNLWYETQLRWEELHYEATKLGIVTASFIHLIVQKNPKNRSMALMIDQPQLEFSPQRFKSKFNDKGIEAYYKFMVDVAVALGASKKQAKKDLLETINFEMALANISFVTTHRNDSKQYDEMTFKDLLREWPNIDWNSAFMKILKPSLQIYDTDTVIVKNCALVSEISDLINKTPKRTLVNYYLWKIVELSIPYLHRNLRKRLAQYNSIRNGDHSEPVHWISCIDSVVENLPFGSDAIYLKKHFDKGVKDDVVEMDSYIKNQFINIFSEVVWFDKAAQKAAVKKIESVESLVAYSEQLFDDRELEEFYQDLQLVNNDYLKSALSIKAFMKHQLLTTFNATRSQSNWMNWATLPAWTNTNIEHFRDHNVMTIPAGLLHNEFFNSDNPRYINYGSLGSIIAHELYHSIDDTGRLHDVDGNLTNWWSPIILKKYHRKLDCFINQYNNYTIEQINKKVNGAFTYTENIADSIGVRIAYLAYQNWVQNNGIEDVPLEIPYTPNQLFWIHYANTWCSMDNPEHLIHLSTSAYPPNEIRVIGSLVNTPEFAADFNCPVNSTMNPQNKCTLW